MSNTMTHKRLASAFMKAGCTVTNSPRFDAAVGKHLPSRVWVATNPTTGRNVEWHVQAAFVPAKDGKAAWYDESNPITTYVCWRSPQTDIMTDCFCDSFYHTIKEAVNSLVRK